MTATRHQNQLLTEFTPGTDQALTYGVTPTAGRLLVTSISIDKNSGAITVPTGFTLIGSTYNSSGTSGAWAYKISEGDEGAITWEWTTSQNSATIWISEYSGVDTLDVQTSANSGASAVTSQTTGTTGTTSVADSLALCMWTADTFENVETVRAYTNSFSEIKANTEGSATALIIAEKDLVSTGAQECTFSTTDSGDQMLGKIAVFNSSAAGAALAGNLVGVATTSADLTGGSDALAGNLVGVATTSANLTGGADALAGDLVATAVVTADLTGGSDALAGDLVATAVVTANLAGGSDALAGDLVATAVVSAGLTGGSDALAGDLVATAVVTANLTGGADALAGDLVATAVVTANLAGGSDALAGNLVATAVIAGALSLKAQLSGDLVATANIAAFFEAADGWETALQKALYANLTGSAPLNLLVTAVHDNPPELTSAFPYVTIGEAVHTAWDTDTELGNEVALAIHSWGRSRGRKEIKAIQNEVYKSLNRATLDVSGYHFVTCDFVSSETIVDSDGKTRHGIQIFNVLMDEI